MKQILEADAARGTVRSDMDPSERRQHAPRLWDDGKT
jgi:hypothetical protein